MGGLDRNEDDAYDDILVRVILWGCLWAFMIWYEGRGVLLAYSDWLVGW